MKRFVCAAAIAAALTFGALAEEEPWGEGFEGWSFTQDAWGPETFCAGRQGNVELVLGTLGKSIVRHKVAGLPPDSFSEAFVGWGPASQADTSTMAEGSYWDGKLTLTIDQTSLEKIAMAGYFEWAIDYKGKRKTGKVTFSSGDAALSNIMDCVAANGGPAAPVAAAPPAQDDPFAEQPFGEGFDGWTFYQRPAVMGGVLCRAQLGEFDLGLFTEPGVHQGHASVPPAGTRKFTSSDAVFDVGRTSEKVFATSNGPQERVNFGFSKSLLDQIVANGGYMWSIGKFGGTVEFPDSIVGAIEIVNDCITANGG